MDRQLRVTDDVCEQHMRDFQLNFFFDLGRHMTRRNGEPPKSLRLNYRESRAKAHSKIAAQRNSILPISIQSVYSSQVVPVVQRIEQGFPNTRTPFCSNPPMLSGMRKLLCPNVLNSCTLLTRNQEFAHFYRTG